MISLARQNSMLKRVQWFLAGSTLLGLAGFYLFVYRPCTQRAAALRTELAQLDLKIQRNEDAARDLDKIVSDVARLREQIKVSRRLPSQQELPQYIRDISHISQNAGLAKFRYAPEQTKPRALCIELPIALEFSGNFPSAAEFVRQVEDLPRMSRTRRLSLKCRDGKSGYVDVQMATSIFSAGEQ